MLDWSMVIPVLQALAPRKVLCAEDLESLVEELTNAPVEIIRIADDETRRPAVQGDPSSTSTQRENGSSTNNVDLADLTDVDLAVFREETSQRLVRRWLTALRGLKPALPAPVTVVLTTSRRSSLAELMRRFSITSEGTWTMIEVHGQTPAAVLVDASSDHAVLREALRDLQSWQRSHAAGMNTDERRSLDGLAHLGNRIELLTQSLRDSDASLARLTDRLEIALDERNALQLELETLRPVVSERDALREQCMDLERRLSAEAERARASATQVRDAQATLEVVDYLERILDAQHTDLMQSASEVRRLQDERARSDQLTEQDLTALRHELEVARREISRLARLAESAEATCQRERAQAGQRERGLAERQTQLEREAMKLKADLSAARVDARRRSQLLTELVELIRDVERSQSWRTGHRLTRLARILTFRRPGRSDGLSRAAARIAAETTAKPFD